MFYFDIFYKRAISNDNGTLSEHNQLFIEYHSLFTNSYLGPNLLCKNGYQRKCAHICKKRLYFVPNCALVSILSDRKASQGKLKLEVEVCHSIEQYRVIDKLFVQFSSWTWTTVKEELNCLC